MIQLKLCAFADESSPEIDHQIEALRRNNIPLLEMRNVDGVNVSNISTETATEVHKKLSRGGIGVWSIGSPFGKIKVTDDFAPHLELFKRALENARILEAKCIRLFSFYADEFTPAARDEVMLRLSAFIDAAKGSGLVLCHENEVGIYGDTAMRCLDIHKTLPELKCVFDPANFIHCDQDIREGWEMLHPYIYYLHIKDALADGRVVPAGQGIGELPWLVRSYAELPGDVSGVMTVEPHLKVFAGFEELEIHNATKMDSFIYKTNDEAFDAAATAIQKIVAAL